MTYFNATDRENRLVGYLASMFGVTSKPPTRQVVSSDPYTIKAPDGSTQTIQRSTTQSTAEANAAYQDQQRATALNQQNTFQQLDNNGNLQTVSGQGPMRATGSIGTPLPQFDSLDDAQAAQQQYYQQYGANDPAIEAAITRMQNPDVNYGDTVGRGPSTDFGAMANQGLTSPYSTPYVDPRNPTGAAPPTGAKVGDQRNMFPTTKPPTKKQARQAEIDAIKVEKTVQVGIDKQGNPIYGKIPDEVETQKAKDALAKRFQEEDKMAMQSQDKKSKQASQAGGTTDIPTTQTKGPDFTMFDTQMAQINAIIAADPDVAATYTPQLMGLLAKRTQIENDFATQLQQFNAQDLNNDGVSDGVENAYSEGVDAATSRANEADRINLENRNINLEAAKLGKEMAEIAQKKFELEQTRNEQLVLDNNIEMERKNRLIANKLGIQSGGNGIRWMADEVRKGVDMLAYLKQSGSLQEAEFALQTGKEYMLNVRQATNNYDSQRMNIDSNFSNDIAELNKMVNLDAKERKEERKAIFKDRFDKIDKNDMEFAGIMKEFNTTMSTKLSEFEKTKRENIKESRDYAKSIRGEIAQNQILKDFKDITTKSALMDTAWDEYLSGNIDAFAVDQALIGLYNKILDPSSVVRPSEYDRTTEDLGYYRSIIAQVEKNILGGGGAGIDDAARSDLVEAAKAFAKVYNEKAQVELEPLLLDVEQFNSDYPDNPVDVSRLFNMSTIYLDDNTLNGIEGIVSSVYGDSPSYSTPPNNISTGSGIVNGVITGYGSSAWGPGLDIATGGKPEPVRAHLGGTVISTVFDPTWKGAPNSASGKQQNSGFGNQIKIRFDDGTEGWFSHLSSVNVQKDSRVEPGQNIGMVGNTGYTMGPTGYHLDLTVVKEYKNGKPVYMDPKEVAVWMRGGGSMPQGGSQIASAPTQQPTSTSPVADPTQQSPMASRGTLAINGSVPSSQFALQEKEFYNPQTGQTVTVAIGSPKEKYYASQKAWIDAANPPAEQPPTKPLVLGGVTLPF